MAMDIAVRATIVLATAIALAAGCASARRGEPITGALPKLDASLERGQRVFMKHCYQCHPGGEAGLGPALNDKPLPGFAMKAQIRLGVGAMPRFSAREIDAAALDDLVAYMKTVRAQVR